MGTQIGDQPLATFSSKALLRLYADIIDELTMRKVLRTRNNPVSDYAVWLTIRGLKLNPGTPNSAYDAIDDKGNRYQVRARRLDLRSSSRQLSVLRDLNKKQFDFLIAVLFDRDFQVLEGYKIPHGLIGRHARFSAHQNGHVLLLQGLILEEPEIENVTGQLRLELEHAAR